jgi:hypothetical protein
MQIEQFVYSDRPSEIPFSFSPQLLFIFGDRELLETTDIPRQLALQYPNAVFSGCSTAGEIANQSVKDHTVIVTGVAFKEVSIKSSKISLEDIAFDSSEAGKQLVSKLPVEGLKHVFVISDGLKVNGTDLVKGMTEGLTDGVTITGGLAGDGSHFARTIIIEPDGKVTTESVAAIGFYGEKLSIGFGSRGGWDSFGLDRRVTRSKDNILYEIDGEPALDLYKSFLGEKAKDLPASGLLFPLSMRDNEDRAPVVRTILGINED